VEAEYKLVRIGGVKFPLLRRGLLRIPRPQVTVPPLALSIERGETLRTVIAWTNIGTVAYAFDLLSLIGNYDPATGEFTLEYGWYVLDVSLAAGASTTTSIDGVIPGDAKGGLRDGLAILCDFDLETRRVTKTYDAYLTEDAIDVVGVGGDITAVAYSVV